MMAPSPEAGTVPAWIARPDGRNAGTAPLRVLVLSAQRFYAEALAAELSRQPGLEARAWLGGDPASDADVVLAEVGSPRGLEAVRHCRDRFSDVPVVAIGLDGSPGDVVACVEAGAGGYVGKEAALPELVEAIERAARGEAFCPPTIVAELFRRISGLARERMMDPVASALLTPRERDVAAMMSRGLTNKAIARELGIRIPTVKSHVHQVLRKLGATSRLTLLAAGARDPGLFRARDAAAPTPPSADR